MVSCFDLAEEVLTTNLLETNFGFVGLSGSTVVERTITLARLSKLLRTNVSSSVSPKRFTL